MQVGVARLNGHGDYRALSSSFDGLNDVNGGKPWFFDNRISASIDEVVSWLIVNSAQNVAEKVMSSLTVPPMIQLYAKYHQVDIGRLFGGESLENVSVYMLHQYVSHKGGSAKKRTRDEDEAEAEDGTRDEAADRTQTRAVRSRSRSRSRQSNQLLEQALPPNIMNKLSFKSIEDTHKNSYGHRLCRVDKRDADGNMIPCTARAVSSKEGLCCLDYSICSIMDKPNKHGWKLPRKRELKLSDFRIKSTEDTHTNSYGFRLCRADVKNDAGQFVPCHKVSQGGKEGFCKDHYNVLHGLHKPNDTKWKLPRKREPKLSDFRIKSTEDTHTNSYGRRLCRADVKNDAGQFIPCHKEAQSGKEGFCKDHYNVLDGLHKPNDTKWKLPRKREPKLSDFRIKSTEDTRMGSNGRRLCRADVKNDAGQFVPCHKEAQSGKEGFCICKTHYSVLDGLHKPNDTKWKLPAR